MKIPKEFYQLHNSFTLTTDFMFVNGIPFLVTFSRNIRFITCEYVPTLISKKLDKFLMKIVKLYARGGFATPLVLWILKSKRLKTKLACWKVIPHQHKSMLHILKDKFTRLRREHSIQYQKILIVVSNTHIRIS